MLLAFPAHFSHTTKNSTIPSGGSCFVISSTSFRATSTDFETTPFQSPILFPNSILCRSLSTTSSLRQGGDYPPGYRHPPFLCGSCHRDLLFYYSSAPVPTLISAGWFLDEIASRAQPVRIVTRTSRSSITAKISAGRGSIPAAKACLKSGKWGKQRPRSAAPHFF